MPTASVPSRRGDSEIAVVVAYFDIALLSNNASTLQTRPKNFCS